MGVTEIGPGQFWSSIVIGEQADASVKDLGCYPVKGHAEVACDVMLLKLRGRGGDSDGRRLPKLDRADEAQLCHSLEMYEHITKQLIKELGDRKEEELAEALKCDGLAAALHSKLPFKGAAKMSGLEAGPSKPAAKPAAVPWIPTNSTTRKLEETAAVPVAKKAAVAPPKPALKKIPPPTVPAVKQEKEKEEEKVEKKEKKVREVKEVEEGDGSADESEPTAAGGLVEPKAIWIRSNPEWPRGSGKFACFVKQEKTKLNECKPITYFTLAVGMVKEVLPNTTHGAVTMVDAKDASRTWTVSYNVKDEVNRVPGNYKGQRYFRQLNAVQAGMGIEPGDVVYFMRDEGGQPQRVRIGIWKKGSKKAERFTATLMDG